MPRIRITGMFHEYEAREVTLTDEEFAELQAGDLDADELLWDAWGDAVGFETDSLEDVTWEIIEEREAVDAAEGKDERRQP